MRAVFGLAGFLVVVGVIAWWMAKVELPYDQVVIKEGQKASEQASQIAGMDSSTGGRASNSVELAELRMGGKLSGILVTKVVPGGAYEKYFGIQRDDAIMAIEYQGYTKSARDLDNLEDGKEQIIEAYQRSGTLIVMRNGKELKLPVPPPPTTSGAAPAQQKNSLQKQLDAITGPR